MKRFLLLLVVAFTLLGGSSAFAQTATATATNTPTATATATPIPNFNVVNNKGAQWVPVAVGTSTPVTIMDSASRCESEVQWSESGDMRCAPIRVGTTTPDFTPSSTTGLYVPHGVVWKENSLTGDPSLGWKCVSLTGTLNVNTLEIYNCFNHKTGSP